MAGRYAKYIPGAAYAAYRSYRGGATSTQPNMAKARSFTRTKTKSNQRSTPLTGQFDYKVDYTKRRLGRKAQRRAKKTRKWRRKVVRTVQNNMIGTTHIVRRNFDSLSVGRDVSDACSFSLNGPDGQGTDGRNSQNDIGEILREMDPASWTALNVFDQPANNQRLFILNAIMEMTVRNSGDNDAIIECYWWKAKTTTPNNVWPSAFQMYAESFNRQGRATNPEIPSNQLGEAQLSHVDVGVTPFQNQLFCRNYTILKRVKYRIQPNQEISFIMKGPSGTYTAQQIKDKASIPKTMGVLFNQQGPPGPATSEPPAAATVSQASRCEYLCVKRYRCKLLENNLAKDAFDRQGD